MNSMNPNPGKFQFMILGKKNRRKQILKINLEEIKEKEVLLSCINIYNELNFKNISQIYVTELKTIYIH